MSAAIFLGSRPAASHPGLELPGRARNGPSFLLVANDKQKRTFCIECSRIFTRDFFVPQIGFDLKPLFLKHFHYFTGIVGLVLLDVSTIALHRREPSRQCARHAAHQDAE